MNRQIRESKVAKAANLKDGKYILNQKLQRSLDWENWATLEPPWEKTYINASAINKGTAVDAIDTKTLASFLLIILSHFL